MTWVLVTICHGERGPIVVHVIDCKTYEVATKLEERRRVTMPYPMWTHHVRLTFEASAGGASD